MAEFVDLHIHSVHSDGIHTPAALVEMAAQKGLRAIALADHDSIDGIEEAINAGERYGIEVIPAVELSVEFQGLRDIHLLGYYIDYRDHAFREKLRLFRERRDLRVAAIIDNVNGKLDKEGKPAISYEEVSALAHGAICRPHIARVLIAHGLVQGIQEAFDYYLVPCNVPKLYFPMDKALAELRRAGGVSVLAHPMTVTADRTRLKNVIKQMAELGLDGLEVFTSSSHLEDVEFLHSVANRLQLVTTGGTDYHGLEDDIALGTGRGGLKLPYSMVASLKQRRIVQ